MYKDVIVINVCLVVIVEFGSDVVINSSVDISICKNDERGIFV